MEFFRLTSAVSGILNFWLAGRRWQLVILGHNYLGAGECQKEQEQNSFHKQYLYW